MTTPSHIHTSGGLISAAFLENIREPGSRQRGVEPESFRLRATVGSPRSGAEWESEPPKSPTAMEETIATAWELLLERWDAVRADLPLMDVSQVRSRWLLPLFDLLDFQPVYLRGDTVLDDEGRLRFPLSHRGWEPDGPVLHTVIPSQDLDGRMRDGGRGASTGSARSIKAKSPHDMLQAFLNASPDDLWAILSNGILLRLLRDYHHTFTKGYVEFGLESIFETRNYGDFRALYRLCHASRFVSPQTSEVSETSEVLMPLEQFYKDSIATGIKVGEDLRGQVRQAIETLGNGFLDAELIRRLQAPSPLHGDGEDLCQQYYSEILHLVYRILFLLFAEQRGMMPGRDSLYAEAYSIARLRARAEGDIPREDDFTDLWAGLQVTFWMVREGVPALGVFGYDGMLFEEVGAMHSGIDSTPGATSTPNASPLLEGRVIRNSDLLRAVRALTLIEREGVLQRISYADLGVEELGSIYESLLDFTPRVSAHADAVNGRDIPPNTFFLDPRGSARKTTGSYYTHPSLVNELIKSALLPVARDRLAAAGLPVIEEDAIGEATAGLLVEYAGLSDEQRAAGEEALLGITVCDPAAGSGHFLVKANNALGAELARVRTGDEYPSEAEVQAAKRDVLAQCIYAVDLNPMAVELCKVSLWINASVADRPLSFLDHHIKCGNSLIGATPELMAEGIPYQAFDQGITGNHRATANAIRARNRQEQGGQLPLGWRVTLIETPEDLARWRRLSRLAGLEPQKAREQYAAYLADDDTRRHKLEADFWTAAFFWPLPKGTRWAPTHGEFLRLCAQGPEAIPPEALAQVEALAAQYRFFHWHLEFPDVFQISEVSETSEILGGFDVILGNPPWERIKLQEKEFFAGRDAAIANARTAAERRRLIRELARTDPGLYAAYADALRKSEATSHFLRDSDRFPLTAGGDINTYAVFAGLGRQIIAAEGRAGLVVPTGIATDYTYRDFFADAVESGQLASLYDFENREGLFPGTHRSYKFSLLTLSGGGAAEAGFSFFLHTASELAEVERCFPLTAADLALMNPNTRTVPVFRRRRDAVLTRKLYHAAPVLHNEQTGENPWGVSFLRMFDMTNDSHLFRLKDELDALSLTPLGSRFVGDREVYLPLYEAKMIELYDHRFAGVVHHAQRARTGEPEETTLDQHRDAAYFPAFRYWVKRGNVAEALGSKAGTPCLVAYKDITTASSERTFKAAIIPFSAVGNSAPVIGSGQTYSLAHTLALLANLNSDLPLIWWIGR